MLKNLFKKEKKIITDEKRIDELLDRSVMEVISKENLKKKLLSGKKLNIKLGIDPTSPNLHLGRAVTLWKLKDFQDLGHNIILLLGDFTGTVGDTSDKESERPMLDVKLVRDNMKTYKKQASKILDMSMVKVVKNSDWLEKLGFSEIGKLADAFSVNEFLQRELIKKRLEKGSRISLREFLYPLMQGYDSVELNIDVEIGGTDQKFNILAGRTLQKIYKQEPQNVLLLGPLLEGTDGRKMSSSWGNTVNLLDKPGEMFGKIMSVNDDLMENYFVHTTRISKEKISKILKMESRDAKIILAAKIVEIYHSKEESENAKNNWITQFSEKKIPDNLEEFNFESGSKIMEILKETNLTKSNGESRRKIDEGAVKILSGDDFENEEKISDYYTEIFKGEKILKLGKKMLKINLK